MKRWSATLLVIGMCSAAVHADVTTVQKTTIEGGAAAMSPGAVPSPVVTTRIKGLKGRTDMDMGSGWAVSVNMSTISDAAAKEIIILDHTQKTARVSTGGQKPPAVSGQSAVGIETSIKPTGKSQTIDGMKCDEYAFTTSMNMSEMGGAQMPQEALDAMKGVTMVMTGSIWVTKAAPGASEYLAYQKAMSSSDLAAAAAGATGMTMPGMDKMMKAMQSVEGLPILTEMNMTIDGTGPIVDMMRQMGSMKLTTKVISVKTDTINDDVFKVPAGYQVIK